MIFSGNFRLYIIDIKASDEALYLPGFLPNAL